MKKNFLVVFINSNNDFVDEKIFQCENLDDVDSLSEKYINDNKRLWGKGNYQWRICEHNFS